MKLKTLTFAGLVMLVLLSVQIPVSGLTGSSAFIEEVVIAGNGFAAGSGQGTAVNHLGLTLSNSDVIAVYTSPVLAAPISFNAVVPQWIADVPDSATLEIRLRTARATGEWSEWYDIRPQPDWMLPGDEEVVGEMVTVPAADVTHQYIQYEVSLARYQGGPAPVLQELRLTFIDTTDGPTVEEMIARQKGLDEAKATANGTDSNAGAAGIPKPTVISRQVWCSDPVCNYSLDPVNDYHPVTHLIVHHTVSNNNNSDWAANVRAIWSFHTFTRGWGDIGYNYLVDPNGVLYEGHLGGDDVIGTHAADANAGTMALAFLGDFRSYTPPDPMLNSAVDLFAWKADQKGIDVYGASNALPNISWGLPNLMGHRDVYGGNNTTCPGDQAFGLLPTLRTRVAEQIGLTSDYIYVDELSSALTLSNANWHTAPGGCGHNTHAYYTFSTTNPAEAVNYGDWSPEIPADGLYELQVYAPYCNTGKAETSGAAYTVYHTGGSSTVVVNQNANVGLWMSLGEYTFWAGSNRIILHLTDLTTTDNGLGIWFDAIRLRPLGPLPDVVVTNQQPVAGEWLTQTVASFTWNFDYPTVVANTTLEVATDAGFTNTVLTQVFPGSVTSFSYDFGADYPDLYWRVTAEKVQGGTSTSAATHFSIDATSPSSTISGVFKLPDGRYLLTWQGSDSGPGIASYDIDYREAGATPWVNLLTKTTAVNTWFTPPDPAKTYQFRSRATDNVGNVEPAHTTADSSTDQAIFLGHAMMLPMVYR
ncbi:MAG: N-acetylmuramoyl-L-alanine amidase [Anaerolineae bacterium]